jgi:2,5-diketo-D-gluconate reductase A
VRSANPARQAENLAARGIQLADDDIAALADLDRGESAARNPEKEEHY